MAAISRPRRRQHSNLRKRETKLIDAWSAQYRTAVCRRS